MAKAPLKPSNRSDPDLVRRRHPEHSAHRLRWRWLLDSIEGGQRYRDAIYGQDTRGMPVFNLVRHKREYPEPRDLAAQAAAGSPGYAYYGQYSGGGAEGPDPTFRSTDDDFELRRARTPVPSFVAEAVDTHLGTVYSKEVQRRGIDGPEFAALRDWMEDVDGKGTQYDRWMRDTFAPLFLVLGQLDLYFDHPPAPEGQQVATAADVARLNLDRCIVSCILPEDILWWSLDPVTGLYTEVVVSEAADPDGGDDEGRYWHWTADESRAMDGRGVTVAGPDPHGYGIVPIVRLFDRRKFRCRNVGQSRYESIADRQKEYYNRDSELVLSDTTQAHPLLQGPEDFVQADGSIPIGPTWLLPKKKNATGTSVSYEGFEVVDFPKDGADSIRKNKADIRNEVDRDARLAKPAGSAATGSGADTVSQSGISKVMDSQTGNKYLAGIASALARCERTILEYALRCLLDRPDVSALMARVEVVYPTDYDLQAPQDLGAFIADFMALLEGAGNCPEAEIIALTRYYRAALPGLDDETYRTVDDEVDTFVRDKAERRLEMAEAAPVAPPPTPTPPGMVPAAPDDEETAEAESSAEAERGEAA